MSAVAQSTSTPATIPQRIAAARAAELRVIPLVETAQTRVDELREQVRHRASERARLLADGAIARDLVAFDRATVERERAIEVAEQALRDAGRLAKDAREERERLELERRAAGDRLRAHRNLLLRAPMERLRLDHERGQAQETIDAIERRIRRHEESVAASEAAAAQLERELAD